jgi:AraC-like DNA-binding protein
VPDLRLDPETIRWLNRSREFLAASLERPVRLDEAAREACLSPFHYHRLFVRSFGETPHEFLTNRRLDEAKRLLASDEASVSEICVRIGYSSLGSFSTLFRARFGMPPTKFRQGARSFCAISGYRGYRFVPACFVRW